MFCRHCGKPIQRDPNGGWIHSFPLRKGCAYPAKTEAEPRE